MSEAKRLGEILSLSTDYLDKNGVEFPRADCEWIVSQALGIPRLQLRLSADRVLQEDELARIRPLLKRRAQSEPLQYILGSTEFFNCEILVGPGVLIPRPETELLVELALEKYQGEGEVLDLCTGSGCVPLAMAKERPDIPALTGVDISDTALDWARKNQEVLRLDNVYFVQGNLYEPVDGMTFGLITANPPYIGEGERADLPGEVLGFEPELALFAEDDGLQVLRRIAERAPEFLAPRGWLICEIGHEQGDAARSAFDKAGLADVSVKKDYNGCDRIVYGRAK